MFYKKLKLIYQIIIITSKFIKINELKKKITDEEITEYVKKIMNESKCPRSIKRNIDKYIVDMYVDEELKSFID